MTKQSELSYLLAQAAAYLESLEGSNVWITYPTFRDMAATIRQISAQIRKDDLSGVKELWNIFAPTCDWDDAGGDPGLGSRIFEIINKLPQDKEGTLQ